MDTATRSTWTITAALYMTIVSLFQGAQDSLHFVGAQALARAIQDYWRWLETNAAVLS